MVVGAELGHGGDEAAKIGRRGIVFLDVALGQGAVLLFAGGDEEGNVEVGTGVGGRLALTEL